MSRPLRSKSDSDEPGWNLEDVYVPQPPLGPTLKAAKASPDPPGEQCAAVFVAHGMGQQIPFATLGQVVEGFLDVHRRRAPDDNQPQVKTRTILHAGERIQRLEVSLSTSLGDDGPRELHFYEGYWAPLTEGKVKIADVTSFLLRAGWNGLYNGSRSFRRWIFGERTEFQIHYASIVGLALSLCLLVALTIYHNTLIGVAVLEFLGLVAPEKFLTPALYRDLTLTLHWVLLSIFLGLFLLYLAKRITDRFNPRPWMTKLGWFGVGVALVPLLVGALAVLLIAGRWLIQALRVGFRPPIYETPFLDGAVRTRDLVSIGGAVLWLVPVLVLAGMILRFLWSRAKTIGSSRKGLNKWGRRAKVTYALAVLAALILLLALAMVVAATFAEMFGFSRCIPNWMGCFCLSAPYNEIFLGGISWILLILAIGLIRKAMIQYVGDVAAYVSSHKLDRFHDLRHSVRNRVTRQLQAVFAHRRGNEERFRYPQVFVMGHSLGSLVSYDALNRLILEDEVVKQRGLPSREGGHLDVLGRTRLLLTFGSPLDKTAYLFAQQGSAVGEARELLATEVQPLIHHEKYRTFPWINVWAREDLISSSLDYYEAQAENADDDEFRRREQRKARIENRRDPRATTPILAHTEYWKSAMIFELLYQEMSGSEQQT